MIGRVHVPALVVAGAQDAVVSAEDVAALAGGLPLGQLCELPDAGHLVPLERPEALGLALEGWIVAADGPSSPDAGGADARTSA